MMMMLDDIHTPYDIHAINYRRIKNTYDIEGNNKINKKI
jgi:hypothetical protein